MITHGLTDEKILSLPQSELTALQTMVTQLGETVAEKQAILNRRKELDRRLEETQKLEAYLARFREEAISRINDGGNVEESITDARLRVPTPGGWATVQRANPNTADLDDLFNNINSIQPNALDPFPAPWSRRRNDEVEYYNMLGRYAHRR